jgi:hypothetical protein
VETVKSIIEAEVAKRRKERDDQGETLSESDRLAARRSALSSDQREIMNYLCEQVKPKVEEDELEDVSVEEDNSDLDDKGDKHVQFLQCFLTYLYTGNYPRRKLVVRSSGENEEKRGIGDVVNIFIDILVEQRLFTPPRARSEMNITDMPFTANCLVRSAVGQIVVELKRMYRDGSHDLLEKVSL